MADNEHRNRPHLKPVDSGYVPGPPPVPKDAEQTPRETPTAKQEVKRMKTGRLRSWLNGRTFPAIIAALVVAFIGSALVFWRDTSSAMDAVEENTQRSKENRELIREIQKTQSAAQEWREGQKKRTDRILERLNDDRP